MSNNKAGWTENESLDWGAESKAPPPPPEPGLYRFDVASAEPAQVGKENKPGIKLQLMLKEPFGGGDSVERKVYATHSLKKEQRHIIKQLAESCDVELPNATGTEAVKEFCSRLLDSRGGVCRVKHGKGLDGLPRAEVAFGSSYLTEVEAKAALEGIDPSEAAAPAVVRRKGNASKTAQA